MKKYLVTLIEEKGSSIEDTIQLEGHIGLTWGMLVDFISSKDLKQHHETIKTTLVKIDFLNGDVFHYLTHLAGGMVKSLGH